jgi:hypothetical protein
MISEQFQELALSTASAFRLGMEAQASEGLVALIDALPQMLEAGSGINPTRLNSLLATMFAAQSRRDYLYLADLLQYELLPPCSTASKGPAPHKV